MNMIGFIKNAVVKSPRRRLRTQRVAPQPGQGKPETSWKTQTGVGIPLRSHSHAINAAPTVTDNQISS